ncbi:MAG: calcium/sodium antiporter [Gammaproteobacteria bacterium]|nr:calcium/sodium antiporter [Gammaproteobacteria bacterium]
MIWPVLMLLTGIVILVLSADKFVEGAAATANRFGMPPLLIGIVVLGFGSSTPEMVVSTLAASQDNPGLALGNALGSNITNIALIIGITALVSPIAVKSSVLKTEFPYLLLVTGLATYLLSDADLTRLESLILLGTFVMLAGWSINQGLKHPSDILATEVESELRTEISLLKTNFYLFGGLFFLILGSRMLVWGGVELAERLGVSDLVIGLTIVAIGTSLPELAASISAIRKKEDDLALGNIIGSNLFNTTLVIGIAGSISPFELDKLFITRDLPVVVLLTVALFLAGSPIGKRPGRINRWEGGAMLACYVVYNYWLIYTN